MAEAGLPCSGRAILTVDHFVFNFGFVSTNPEVCYLSGFVSTNPEVCYLSGFVSTNPETLGRENEHFSERA
jgi:hypothetical protein